MRPRMRTLKPEVFLDEELWDLAERTGFPILQGYEGLWCYADREGRFEWRPRALQSLILPYWRGDFEGLLEALVADGKVVRYVVDGKVYGWVRNLLKHQCPNAREPASVLPPPPDADTCTHVHARAELGDAHAEHGGIGSGSGSGIGSGIGFGSDGADAPEAKALRSNSPAPSASKPRMRSLRNFPEGWTWSTETAAKAAKAGVTPAELRDHVDYWTIHDFAALVREDKLDAELQRSFDGIIERRKGGPRRIGASPPAANPYAWRPTDAHRKFATDHDQPLEVAVRAYREGGRPDRLVTTAHVDEDFMQRLERWATSGEFIAEGQLPRRQKGAA